MGRLADWISSSKCSGSSLAVGSWTHSSPKCSGSLLAVGSWTQLTPDIFFSLEIDPLMLMSFPTVGIFFNRLTQVFVVENFQLTVVGSRSVFPFSLFSQRGHKLNVYWLNWV